MKKKTRIISGIVVLVALIGLMTAIYIKMKPSAQVGTKEFSLAVVNDVGERKSYEGKTDVEYLSELMDELQETTDFSYQGDSGEYGLYINTINGLTADYATNGAYWSIYVNGEYGQYGADQQPVMDGDEFEFVYTTGE